MMDDNDKGHRFGNFPNYYAFHPPANRLQVLARTGILNYIRNGLLSVFSSSNSSTDEEYEQRTKRIKQDEKMTTTINYYYYCDLGCNAGELTMAMATALLPTEHQHLQTKNDVSGCNGNEDATSTSGTTCNNDTNITTVTTIIKCLGLDIDPTLINRANEKFAPQFYSSTDSSTTTAVTSDEQSLGCYNDKIVSTFKVCNLCSEIEHSNTCSTFASENGINASTTPFTTTSEENGSGVALPLLPLQPSLSQRIFHLTTIFSTTMWIHIHSGDDGLHAFLTRACNYTQKYIIIEPQPSNCYRKANVRLRKMKRPELFNDTSSSSSSSSSSSTRLAMRNTIEIEIERIVLQSGFRRVMTSSLVIDSSTSTITNKQQVTEVVHNDIDKNKLNQDDDITSWNRCIQLYERL